MIDPKSIGIAAITYYPKWYSGRLRNVKHIDKVRGDLALEFVRRAVIEGYQLVVVDARSPKTFRKKLLEIEGVKVLKRRSAKRSPGKRMAIKMISRMKNVKVIICSEIEKVSIAADCIPLIVKPLLNNETDVVVPKREGNLFQLTYPQYMYESEIEGNKLYNEILKTNGLLKNDSEDLDMFFGPRAFRNDPKIISLFMRKYHILSSEYFDSEDWSNTLYFPIILALKERLRVKSVTVPFLYPKIQKQNEEASAKDVFFEKRRAQKLGLLVELLHFMNFIGKNKK